MNTPGAENVYDASTWTLTNTQLLTTMIDLDSSIVRLEAQRLAMMSDIDIRLSPTELGFRNAGIWLASVTLLTPAQARRIHRLALLLRNHPTVKDAVDDGTISADSGGKIADFCEHPPKDMPQDLVDDARDDLIDRATGPAADADILRACITRIYDHWAPDKPPPAEDNDRNEFFASPTSLGRVKLSGDFDAVTGEKLLTLLSVLAKPVPTTDGRGNPIPDPRTPARRRADAMGRIFDGYLAFGTLPDDGGERPHTNLFINLRDLTTLTDFFNNEADEADTAESEAEADGADADAAENAARTAAERDAGLWDAATAAATARDTGNSNDDDHHDDNHDDDDDDDTEYEPGYDTDSVCAETADAGKNTARVPHRNTYRDMVGEGGIAWTPRMGPLTRQTSRELSCDCVLAAIILDEGGNPVDLKRDKRTVSRAQRRALIARDHGCTFPGCGTPASWTHAHHIKHWADGGDTAIINLCLLCPFHHHLIHSSGWDVIMGADQHPWFLPPKTVDSHRTPQPAHNRQQHRTQPNPRRAA